MKIHSRFTSRHYALMMLTAVLVLTSARSASAQTIFGYWNWTPGGSPPVYYGNPRDACIALLSQLKKVQGEVSYRGVQRATDFETSNSYTCNWTRDSDHSKQQSINALRAQYVCPANATAASLHNSGKAADMRCMCSGTPCVSPSPPALDTSPRCQTKLASTTPVTAQQAAAASAQNQKLAAKGLPGVNYGAVAKELKATEDCSFKKGDFYSGSPSDVHIGYLCGYRDGDEIAANNIAGLASTPAGYVWHHSLDLGRMQLVTQDAHKACGSHIGGAAAWKEALGLPEYLFHLPPLQ